MDLYPSIDIRDGRCVRLEEGDFARETVYASDPVEVARSFGEAGAAWIHVVDLDAALRGQPVHLDVIERVCRAVEPLGSLVQAGGGVRSLDAAQRLFSAGVERVVLGTAAVEDPGLLGSATSRWPERVGVGLDHRDGEVMVRGWASGSGMDLTDAARAAVAAGASVVVVTDISRDGLMAGPDVEGLSALLGETAVRLIASGGVRGIEDVRALSSLPGMEGVPGLEGVIVGRAIYEGKLDVAATLAWLREAAGR